VVPAGSTSDSNGLAIAGLYGTLTVGADGSYVYNINEDVTNSWDENDFENETFVVQVSDGSGAAVEQTVLVYVYGTNDAPVAGAAITNSDAVEAGVDSDGNFGCNG
jgi:VCBS repeat-containing protein